ncbi:hypothetical protein [Halorubrum vacuolatum]|uniref:Uncharacterized protein n=1 Tax=Halorubrum vacuolatum TaxID=63740 RepID=A0A238Y1Y9_HALVU|nr:hypothetical protein [Halorubrum vacuolatum]SNR64828.1 hypothetical protein SAMN06264855_12722 [Halorubrum vacuolatum]
MPEISNDKTTAHAYPPKEIYNAWGEHAEELNMSISQYIIRMVESGRKNINMEDSSSDTLRELLQQRATLSRQVERQRDRIKDLERQLEQTSQSEIASFVTENPGVQTPVIIQHVADTVPGRVAGHLDALEGSLIERRDSGYYPINADERSEMSQSAPDKIQ